MGNCLKSGSGQQDNATLLANSPDPAITSSLSQDSLGAQSMPYNVIIFLSLTVLIL